MLLVVAGWPNVLVLAPDPSTAGLPNRDMAGTTQAVAASRADGAGGVEMSKQVSRLVRSSKLRRRLARKFEVEGTSE